jgi:AcrR family transcriptional regulator
MPADREQIASGLVCSSPIGRMPRLPSTKPVAPGRTRANDPEGVRRRVLDAAASLFQLRGYTATGTHDIFDEAGITSGAFYHHFAGKKELGLAVVRERVAIAVEDTWLAPLRDARSTLDGVTDVFARIGKELDQNRAVRGCPVNNLAIELAYADEDFRRELKTVFDRWRSAIAAKLVEDMERRIVRRRDPDALASYVISVYSGAMALAKVEQRSQPLDDCLTELASALSTRS